LSNPLTEARQPALATSDGTIRAFWLAGADELPALVYRLLDRSGPPPRGPIAALTGPGAFVMQHRVASVPGGFLVAWTDVEAQARVALIGTDGGVRWTASLSDLEDPRAVRIGTLGVVAAAPPAVQLVLVVQPDIRKASVRFVRFGLDGVRFEDVEVPDASFLAADMSEGAVTLWSQEMSRGKLTHCARRYALTGKPLGAAACDTSDGPRARAARARVRRYVCR
jgi:hypothetical protein